MSTRAIIERRATGLEVRAVLTVVFAVLIGLAVGTALGILLFRNLPRAWNVIGAAVGAAGCLLVPTVVALFIASNLRFQAAMLRLQLLIEANTRRTADAVGALVSRALPS